MRGILQTEYDKWRTKWGKPKQSVRKITDDELNLIYDDYWDKVEGDKLKPGVDLTCFDAGVNTGTARNGQFVRRVLGYNPVLQNVTTKEVTALNQLDPVTVVKKYNDYRLKFHQSLKTFKTFGKGWTNRIADVRANSLAMASKGNVEILKQDATELQQKAAGDASKATKTIAGSVVTPTAGGVTASASGYDWTPILTFGGIVLVVGIAVALYFIWKSKQTQTVSDTVMAKAVEIENGGA
jgi:lysozyme family protein